MRGRPPLIDKVIETRPDGTKATVADLIIERVRVGTPRRFAAVSVGISVATLYAWRAAGWAARTALELDPDHPLTEFDRQCLDFLDRLERADAEMPIRALGQIQQAAAGGARKTKTTTVTRYDATGAVVGMEETTVVEVMPPLWTPAAWLLERRFPEEFGRRTDVTLHGPEEEVDESERAEKLSLALRSVLEQAQAIEASSSEVEPAQGDPDVLTVDGEPV